MASNFTNKRNTKPHITKISANIWMCLGAMNVGYGYSPRASWLDWKVGWRT